MHVIRRNLACDAGAKHDESGQMSGSRRDLVHALETKGQQLASIRRRAEAVNHLSKRRSMDAGGQVA